MPIVVGTDEAGYGPNLGPLVITATSWEIPDGLEPENMWQALATALTDAPARRDKRLHVSDSKKVYSAGKSLAPLERAVLAFLSHLNLPCDNGTQLGTSLSGTSFADDFQANGSRSLAEIRLPLECDRAGCVNAAATLTTTLEAQDIRLLGVRSCIMFPTEFNHKVQLANSKGKVLSAETLQLVKSSVDAAQAAGTTNAIKGWVICDKHGGRNRYDDIISEAFDDCFVFRIEESGPQSLYRVGKLEFCFRTKAEAILPVALASMVSKYVREVGMAQFNRFWRQHLPELKPTKGYPQDAVRFWADIEKTVTQLKMAKTDIWRSR